ncbi:protein TIFY 11c-like [Carica papaya]|uniref:protein TIFY 11c-like n=1 Tax=Carica papaya TaxID=3649 RepID=UPI000B8D017A|nr:protein TIFY 11c-like [Carica papaya]
MLCMYRFEGMQSSRDDAENPSTAQLTIFYAGAVNVYDNVSIEKAHAIMVLAGENSLPRPKEKPSTEMRSTQLSACSLQSNLPIARKISLQHFIEKRKSRVMSQSPYAPPARKEKESAPNANDPTNISLLPFILL